VRIALPVASDGIPRRGANAPGSCQLMMHDTELNPPAATPAVSIRSLRNYGDLEACVALQHVTWGEHCREIVPPAVLLVAQKLGGLALGAFDGTGNLVGTLFGMTGLLDGEPVHWSHMLAVREEWRDRHVGQLLKGEQRRRLSAMGVHRIRWTFDPLVARNAHVNVHRLGSRVLEYVEDMYGDSPLSLTDSVIGSDRLVVEWRPRESAAEAVPTPDIWPRVKLEHGVDQMLPEGTGVLLEVPRDIQSLKQADPERAVAWRSLTRRAFKHLLGGGYRVADFLRGRAGTRGCYVIVPPSDDR
jgi:chorismate synthase